MIEVNNWKGRKIINELYDSIETIYRKIAITLELFNLLWILSKTKSILEWKSQVTNVSGLEFATWKKLLTEGSQIATKKEKGPIGSGRQEVEEEHNTSAIFYLTVSP